MAKPIGLYLLDRILKPKDWYRIHALTLNGYKLVASKDDQKNAGMPLDQIQKAARKTRGIGMNPIKPYRDYYGQFILESKFLSEPLQVKYAIGYALQTRVVTVDDFSSFSWLRLAPADDESLYPNLSKHQQLLLYLMQKSVFPKFVVSRVYYYLQTELYQSITSLILERESLNQDLK
jgi:hypothetical protein